jgi:hypothetical protein
MVAYSAYRYNDGSANNAELRRETQVGSADEAWKLVGRIEKAAKGYKEQCNGTHDDDDVVDDLPHEETEQYLIDWLIGGACGGFFHPGAKAYVEYVRREVLEAPAADVSAA